MTRATSGETVGKFKEVLLTQMAEEVIVFWSFSISSQLTEITKMNVRGDNCFQYGKRRISHWITLDFIPVYLLAVSTVAKEWTLCLCIIE